MCTIHKRRPGSCHIEHRVRSQICFRAILYSGQVFSIIEMIKRPNVWIGLLLIVVFSTLNMFLFYRYTKAGDKVRPRLSVEFDERNGLRSGVQDEDIETLRRLQGEHEHYFQYTEYMSNFPLNKVATTKLIMKTAEMYTNLYKTKMLNHKCHTCAVVTSSGRLVNTSAGLKIDQSDCVIRMNNAPVTGYEKDVGERTDIRIVGNVNAKFLQSNSKSLFHYRGPRSIRRNRHIVVMPWLFNDTVNMTGPEVMIAKNLTKNFPHLEFYIPTKLALLVVEDIFQFETGFQRSKLNTWFTTGWQTMLLSLSMCNKVHVYGMPQYELCSESDSTLYHYYDKRGLRECDYYKKSEINPDTGHLFITEKAIFARWAKRYKNIIFHYPSWNLSSVDDDRKLDSPFIHELDLANLRETRRLQQQEAVTHYKFPKEPLYIILFSFSLLFILIQLLRFAKLLVQMFDMRNNTW